MSDSMGNREKIWAGLQYGVDNVIDCEYHAASDTVLFLGRSSKVGEVEAAAIQLRTNKGWSAMQLENWLSLIDVRMRSVDGLPAKPPPTTDSKGSDMERLIDQQIAALDGAQLVRIHEGRQLALVWRGDTVFRVYDLPMWSHADEFTVGYMPDGLPDAAGADQAARSWLDRLTKGED